MMDLFNCKDFPTTINIRVTPKAKSERIKAVYLEDGSVFYKIYVTVAAEDGKANKAVIALIAKELGVAKSKLIIRQGKHSRDKVLEIIK